MWCQVCYTAVQLGSPWQPVLPDRPAPASEEEAERRAINDQRSTVTTLDNPLSPEIEAATIAKLNAEADFYKHNAKLKAAEAWGAEQSVAQLKASADAARIFPFWAAVNKATAGGCMDTLSQWVREDPEKDITIVFNSPGGEVISGLALYDHIKILQNEGATINTHSLGYAASMGGILLQAGQERRIGKHGYILIHEVSSGAIGNISEMEDELEFSKRLQKRLLNILAERSQMTPQQIARKWKRKDWWLDATEALELGFVDRIAE